jgi:hypothetical protein
MIKSIDKPKEKLMDYTDVNNLGQGNMLRRNVRTVERFLKINFSPDHESIIIWSSDEENELTLESEKSKSREEEQ